MPVGAFVPSRIHLDYPEWQAPLIGNVGQVWAYDGTGYVPTTFLLASAVSAYGLTLASAADAAAARTALELGTAAVLNVGTGANQIVQLDGSSRLPAVDGSQLTGVTVAAAGSSTQIQYNNAGAFAGDAGMTYNAATDRLTVAGGLVAGDWSPPSDSTTAVSIWNAARSARVVTVDTTNRRVGIGGTPTAGLIHVFGRIATNGDLLGIAGGGFSGGFQMWKDSAPNSAANIGMSVPGGAATDHFIMSTLDGGWFERFRVQRNGYIAIGQSSATALLDLADSTTTRASLRIRAGTAPTTPNAGDIWYPIGGRLNVYRAATETIASGVPDTGGSATATGTWGATEQSMLQKCYDIVRAFGMLS